MVGKIGTAKRTPVKPAVKRVAKPGAKPGAKPAVKRVANAVKRVANAVKRVAKPGVKRAGVKRATPKAKKVNFNKLLIIIRNVANRTHKKGRMTGGALEDAKNTIFKYLVGSELTSAIIGLIQNDDSNPNALTTSTQEDNFLFRQSDGIKKVGTGGSMVELLTAVDNLLSVMKSVTTAQLEPANGNLADNMNLNYIAHIIAEENKVNFVELTNINNSTSAFNISNAATLPLEAAVKVATDGATPVEINNTPMTANLPANPLNKLDDNFDKFNNSPSLAISSISTDNINTSYTALIKILDELTYNTPYEFIKNPANTNIVANVRKQFAMLMIAITLAKIHKIIEEM